jgi:hypothetical protein
VATPQAAVMKQVAISGPLASTMATRSLRPMPRPFNVASVRWAARIKPGTILFEIAGVPEDLAKQAMARIAYKMPVKCRFVGRRIAV